MQRHAKARQTRLPFARVAPAAAPRPWDNLPANAIALIAEHLECTAPPVPLPCELSSARVTAAYWAPLMAMRAVCRHWRTSVEPAMRGPFGWLSLSKAMERPATGRWAKAPVTTLLVRADAMELEGEVDLEAWRKAQEERLKQCWPMLQSVRWHMDNALQYVNGLMHVQLLITDVRKDACLLPPNPEGEIVRAVPVPDFLLDSVVFPERKVEIFSDHDMPELHLRGPVTLRQFFAAMQKAGTQEALRALPD